MVIEEIIQKASELSLPDFLKWLVGSGILAKLGAEQIKKVYELIRKKHDEGKYGFVPNKDEVYTLKKLAAKSVYKDFREILKNHWGADVVRTGLYILNLEHKKEVEKIKEVKQQVFDNKKILGLRLVEMVTEGVMRAVLDHLKNLKDKHNYSQEDILREFDELLQVWKKITIFVKNEDSIPYIVKQAKELIDKKEETFFIFARGKAIETACSSIIHLQKDKYLLDKGYVWFANMDSDTLPASYYCGVHSSAYLM